MKNLLKKLTKKETKATIQKIDKKQLEKVIGGVETVKSTSIQDESKGFSSLIR
ncbi:MAG: hypothetical protein V4565_08705 [Bacteroidota bacterium]